MKNEKMKKYGIIDDIIAEWQVKFYPTNQGRTDEGLPRPAMTTTMNRDGRPRPNAANERLTTGKGQE